MMLTKEVRDWLKPHLSYQSDTAPAPVFLAAVALLVYEEKITKSLTVRAGGEGTTWQTLLVTESGLLFYCRVKSDESDWDLGSHKQGYGEIETWVRRVHDLNAVSTVALTNPPSGPVGMLEWQAAYRISFGESVIEIPADGSLPGEFKFELVQKFVSGLHEYWNASDD